MLAKILIVGFCLFLVLLAFAMCKVSGYWSRVEEQEELEELLKKEKDSEN